MQDKNQTRLDQPMPRTCAATEVAVDPPRRANLTNLSQSIQSGDSRQHLRSDSQDDTVAASLPCHIKIRMISAEGICVELPAHANVKVNDEINLSDGASPRIGIVRWIGTPNGERLTAGLEWK